MIKYDLIYNLHRIARSFRDAIDAAKANREPYIFFNKFPYGQCGYTTDLLAKYLTSKGYTRMIYETGVYYWEDSDSNPDHIPRQHTWLLVEGLIIDITRDQFKDFDEPVKNNIPVYVGPKTPYYELFEVHPYGRCETSGYNTNSLKGKDLDSWYQVILKYLFEEEN